MGNIGFKISIPSVNVKNASSSQLLFTSSIYADKIMAEAVAINVVHGLGYKPTLIATTSSGNKDNNTWVDNYQIHIGGTTSKAIALSQQGT